LRLQASYVLHSAVAPRLPTSPVVDFVLAVLPLLIGVTLASAQPALFVGFLLISAVLLGKRPAGGTKHRRNENARRKIIREADVDADDAEVKDDGGKSGATRR
jgi:hypothetical protein